MKQTSFLALATLASGSLTAFACAPRAELKRSRCVSGPGDVAHSLIDHASPTRPGQAGALAVPASEP